MPDDVESADPVWSDLTDAQRFILYGSGTGGRSLTELLNGWVGGEDAAYWNRKGPYVAALVEAAQSLVELGLVEVWEEPMGAGEDALVPPEDGLVALGDPGNWWRYDPEDNWDLRDLNEDLSRYAGVEASDASATTAVYTLFATDAAKELGLIRWPWWCGPARPPAVRPGVETWPEGEAPDRRG